MATLRALGALSRGWRTACASSSRATPCLFPAAGQGSVNGATQVAAPAFAFSPVSCTSGSLRGLLMGPRSFQSSAAALMPEKLTIVVPSMGDSIVEGTICSVLKAQGDSVAEDEVIAQIETDKVTVDVRAPKSGVISSLMVKEDENVEIGQTVAHLIPGEAPQAASNDTAAPEEAPAEAAAASPAPAAPSSGRASLIQFPPRVTAKGERISSLSASDQKAALEALSSGSSSSSSSSSSSPASAAPEATAAPAAAAAAGSTSERLTSQPPRYPYTEKEMECIMLGGADMVDVRIAVSVQVTVG